MPTRPRLLLIIEPMKKVTIRKMSATDWDSVAAIYKEGITTGFATFETNVPSFEAWDKAHMTSCRFVALLLKHLIDASEQEGIWTLQSGIFPTNHGSIKLHEAVGFRLIGTRERVGKLNGQWIDNVLFERRSRVVGVD